MAFSFYFSDTLTNNANEHWNIKTKSGKEWKIESECSVSNQSRMQKITFNGPDVTDYTVEVDTYWNGFKKSDMSKMQDLSDSNVIDIDHFSQERGFMEFLRPRNRISYLKFFPKMCHFSPDAVMPENSEEKPIEIRTERQLEELSNDFEALLKNGYLSDVVLNCGSIEIKAHKLILSARSAVFAKMFELPMKENMENRVNISDLEECVLQQMVSYIYSGEVTFTDASLIRGLYIAGDKYALYQLKSLCSSTLQNVTMDTVMDTLVLADLYTDSNLKNAAMKYICENYSILKASDRWNSFLEKYPSLAVEILRSVLEHKEL